jgi:glycerate kinase
LHAAGFAAVFSLCDGPLALRDAMSDGFALMRAAAEEVTRTFMAGMDHA